MPMDYSADALAEVGASGGYIPQYASHWYVLFPSEFTDGSDALKLAVDESSHPSGKNEVIAIKRGNAQVHVAGRYTVDEYTMQLNDFVTPKVYEKLMKWRDKVFNKGNKQLGNPSDYKKDLSLVLMGPNNTVNREIQIIGAFPSSDPKPTGSLSQGSTELVKLSFALTFDDFKVKYE